MATALEIAGCPYRRSDPKVLVMQFTEISPCNIPFDTLKFVQHWRARVQRARHASLFLI
jgi:hypothetical protein